MSLSLLVQCLSIVFIVFGFDGESVFIVDENQFWNLRLREFALQSGQLVEEPQRLFIDDNSRVNIADFVDAENLPDVQSKFANSIVRQLEALGPPSMDAEIDIRFVCKGGCRELAKRRGESIVKLTEDFKTKYVPTETIEQLLRNKIKRPRFSFVQLTGQQQGLFVAEVVKAACKNIPNLGEIRGVINIGGTTSQIVDFADNKFETDLHTGANSFGNTKRGTDIWSPSDMYSRFAKLLHEQNEPSDADVASAVADTFDDVGFDLSAQKHINTLSFHGLWIVTGMGCSAGAQYLNTLKSSFVRSCDRSEENKKIPFIGLMAHLQSYLKKGLDPANLPPEERKAPASMAVLHYFLQSFNDTETVYFFSTGANGMKTSIAAGYAWTVLMKPSSHQGILPWIVIILCAVLAILGICAFVRNRDFTLHWRSQRLAESSQCLTRGSKEVSVELTTVSPHY